MTNKNTPPLHTERLILRKFTETDTQAFFEIMADKDVNTFLPWFPLTSLAQASVFLQERFLSWYAKPSACRYAICLKKTDTPIGYVNLADDESNDLGYGLKKEFWHKGLVTEAAKAVVAQLKRSGYSYITATHDILNPHSGGVMQKLGMLYKYSYVEQVHPKDLTVTFRLYQLNFDGNEARTYMEYWNKHNNHFIEENNSARQTVRNDYH